LSAKEIVEYYTFVWKFYLYVFVSDVISHCAGSCDG